MAVTIQPGIRQVRCHTREDRWPHTHKAVERFADNTGVVIGTIAYNELDLNPGRS
jgi:hypothetical protein